MKVLITGATGFTGGHLARELVRRGCEVRAIVRSRARAHSLIDHGIEIIEGDVMNRHHVLTAAQGVDTIYHIAAAYREARHDDQHYWDVNVGGAEHIIEAARAQHARLVHCSTGGVHGHVRTVPADEDSPFNPGDVYQRSKLEGELRVRDAMQDGLVATIARPAAIYGPGDVRLLKLFRAVQSGSFRMIGSGETLYHLVYISDLVDGLILCGTRDAAVGRTYLLAGPRYTTLNELVDMIAAAVGARVRAGRIPVAPVVTAARICEWLCKPLRIEPPLHRRRVEFFIMDRAFTCERARRELGYTPRIPPAQGLAMTAQWYMEHGLLRYTGAQPTRFGQVAGEQA